MQTLIQRLESLDRQGWRFGLDITRALLAQLGDPQRGLSFAHVAGTNGKGSTCSYLSSLLAARGLKTGLYTSPHLCDVRERFQINGVPITAGEFKRWAERVLAAGQAVKRRTGRGPTTFEALTALAALWFKDRGVEVAVWEVGLGGRLDATNAIDTPAVALLAPVGLEHCDYLGDTVAKIAREKAGILKPGVKAATVQDHPEALKVIRDSASRAGAELWVGDEDFKYRATRRGLRWEAPGFEGEFVLKDRPPYDVDNAALALAGYHLLRLQGFVSGPPTASAVMDARWPGRFEVVSKKPLVLLDGAHNPAGARRLAEGLRACYPGRKWVVLNGFLRDKAYGECVEAWAPLASRAIVTEPPVARSEQGDQVVREWEKRGVRALWIKDPAQALAYGMNSCGRDGLLVCGSLYLIGQIRSRFK
jgi:dihydrofolate synthase/folylpolyglutamate synthase